MASRRYDVAPKDRSACKCHHYLFIDETAKCHFVYRHFYLQAFSIQTVSSTGILPALIFILEVFHQQSFSPSGILLAVIFTYRHIVCIRFCLQAFCMQLVSSTGILSALIFIFRHFFGRHFHLQAFSLSFSSIGIWYAVIFCIDYWQVITTLVVQNLSWWAYR